MKGIFSFCLALSLALTASGQTLLQWEAVDDLDEPLPEEVKVFKSAGRINDDTISAWYSLTDLSTGNLTLFPIHSDINIKPHTYLRENEDVVLLCNGGYFGFNVSYSLVLNNYQLHASNASAVSRSYNGENVLYYPTRGAFGINPEMSSEAAYVYSFSDGETWAYPEASPITTANPPLPRPGYTFPEGGTNWDVSEAIGGGPLLITGGKKITDYSPELFSDAFSTIRHPRTAIGVTDKGEIIQLVVDGRQEHSGGVALQTLADILLELGCVEAINLDGGGSSCLLAGEQVLNLPSDGSTRSIPSVVAIKKCHNFPADNPDIFSFEGDENESVVFQAFGYELSHQLQAGKSGTFHLDIQNPSEFRIDFIFNGEQAGANADSMYMVLNRPGSLKDSIKISLEGIGTTRFVNLGSYQLGLKNTLTLHNAASDAPLFVSGLRLIRVASGLPGISLVPDVNYGTFSLGEELISGVKARSTNTGRLLVGYRLYELASGLHTLLEEDSFEAASLFEKDINYRIEKEADPIKLIACVFDALGDSVTVTYAINLDNSPPTIGLGKNSSIYGVVGDTLVFEIKVYPANDSRPLKTLTVLKNPDQENEILANEEVSDYGDTIIYSYPLSARDVPGIHFRFNIEDAAGYSSDYDYSLAVSSEISPAYRKPELVYLGRENALMLKGNFDRSGPARLRLIYMNGRILYQTLLDMDNLNRIPLPPLAAGWYISVLESDKQSSSLKFMVIQ